MAGSFLVSGIYTAILHTVVWMAELPFHVELTSIDLIGLVFVSGIVFWLTIYTGLVSPVVGLLVMTSGILMLESLVMPSGEIQHLTQYGHSYPLITFTQVWYLLAPVAVFFGSIEWGIRAGYGIGTDRLRNLPDFPVSAQTGFGVAVLSGLVFGVAIFGTMETLRLQSPTQAYWGLIGGFLVVTIAVSGLLLRGLLVPSAFALYVVIVGLETVFLGGSEVASLAGLVPLALLILVSTGIEWGFRHVVFPHPRGRFNRRTS